MAEELDPDFMDKGKHGVIADMAAIVQVGDAYGDFHRKGEMLGQD
jgi:hypothetical protein